MVKPELKIELGKSILSLLDQKGVCPTAFLWFYLPDNNSWRLVIASKKFDNKDQKDNYQDFIKTFGSEKSIKEVDLSNITILSGQNDLLSLLKVAIKTPHDATDGIKFTSNVINGVFIDDAYIYRLS